METSTNNISMTFALIFPYVVSFGICAVLAIIPTNDATISAIRAEIIHKGDYPELTVTHEGIPREIIISGGSYER